MYITIVRGVNRSVFIALTAMALFIVGLFGAWWFQPVRIPANFTGTLHFLDLFLFLIVSYIIWHPIVMQVLTLAIASNIKTTRQQRARPGLKVAFITTFVPGSESIELLRKTLPAMVHVSYAHDTWLLDEGNDPEARALCQELGVHHFSRHGKPCYNTVDGKFAAKTKGGNHNSWYDTAGNEYDIVAQIDTDFIPKKSFLIKTLGYFKDQRVAFVGTPQIYGNTAQSLIARGAAEQTYSFYGPILRGLYGMDTTLLIGANHVIRVAALKEVGHYSAHITEDLLTGMKLHANGWKSVYVPEALAIGEGPSTWQTFFSQQMRWAYGCMDILFRHSPKLLPLMNWRQRIYYFFLQQHYFSGLVQGLSVLGLALYFLFGVTFVRASLLPFLRYYLPVVLLMAITHLWLQRFNVRPKQERGLMLAGALVNVAVWPIFLLAFIGVVFRKRLTYKVTPKGKQADGRGSEPMFSRLFLPHYIVGGLDGGLALTALISHRWSPIMVFWAVITSLLLLAVPFAQGAVRVLYGAYAYVATRLVALNAHYRFLEFTTRDEGKLPQAPMANEKYLYVQRQYWLLLAPFLISFSAISLSTIHYLAHNLLLRPLLAFTSLTVVYFVVSLLVNVGTRDFDLAAHKKKVRGWRPEHYPSVDVFLPTAGEPTSVLRNTWRGVKAMAARYPGRVTAYCLDDSARDPVAELAARFGFTYVVRPNRGEFKKAGNLRYGFKVSNGEFIVIFDADFRPRWDFLAELLPYMEHDPRIGIVQSPQYFDVSNHQNWLERGAGAVQELFYRFSQVSRQSHQASICVGSNALYRRTALNDTGGTALIEHSEDVHTGFNLRIHGWSVQYVPIILAKGLCPSALTTFFKQQYRWCLGSMSLLSSCKFWTARLSLRARASYFSGFLYYIHTALSSFYVPIIPLSLLILYPDQVQLMNYLLIVPSLVVTQVIYPMWHGAIYGLEAWAVRMVYGWAHLFAIFDTLTGAAMQWHPTGTKAKRDLRYVTFRVLQVVFNFIPALAWVGLASFRLVTQDSLQYLPILLAGVYYLLISAKVTFFMHKEVVLHTEHIRLSARVSAATNS